jgi:hypothetical protein
MSSEDDYTAFDSTQNLEFLNFDMLMMERFGLPAEFIDIYVDFMTHIQYGKKTLGPMMPSGCKFTLVLNTLRSLAYQCLKYDLTSKQAMCATGDDVALNAVLPESDAWNVVKGHFLLVSKRQVNLYPTFCGWVLNPVCCYKQPSVLLYRTLFHMDIGDIKDCVLNYCADFSPTWANLELLLSYMTPDDVEKTYDLAALLKAAIDSYSLGRQSSFLTKFGAIREYQI